MVEPAGVTQTILAGDPSGRPGNCLQAAVATILGCPIEDVPHFVESTGDWLGATITFAAENGYQVFWRDGDGPVPDLGLAFGFTNRDPEMKHAVAIRQGRVWDPHPSRAGLVQVANYLDWKRIGQGHSSGGDDRHG